MMREKDALLNPCAKRISTSTRMEFDATAGTQPVSLRRNRRAGATLLLVLGLLVLMMIPGQLLAQSVGNIFGDVQDTSGAMIPGATVTVISAERSVTRTVTSNDNGQFSIPSLPIGTYKVTVTMDRFQKFERSGIVLDADSNVKLTCSLQVAGAAPTTVEVQDTASGVSDINLQTATVGTLIAPNIVENMPLQDNSIVGVAATLPGVVDVNAPATFTGDSGGPTYSTAGSRMNANLFLFDGLMYNNLYRNTGLNYPPSEAIQEVSVLVNNYSAEYGRNTGGVFNSITKSGTNEFHGALWDTHRNAAFNAVNWMAKYQAAIASQASGQNFVAKNLPFIQNQFGSTFGGPIKKDKLYFFAAYQGLRLRQWVPGQGTTIFTPAELGNPVNGVPTTNADWSDILGSINLNRQATGQSTYTVDNLLKNPITGSSYALANIAALQYRDDANKVWNAAHPGATPRGTTCVADLTARETLATSGASPTYKTGYLPGAIIPKSCLSPVTEQIALRYLGFSPVGDQPIPTSGNNPKTDDNGFIRMDYNLGKHTINGSLNIVNADDDNVNTGQYSDTDYAHMNDWARSKFYTVGDQWIISQSLLNTFRAGYRNFSDWTYPLDHTTAADLGIAMPTFGTPALPSFSAGSNLVLGGSSYTWSQAMNKSVEFSDALSWTKGSHTIQFGATYLRLRYERDSDGGTQGGFHYTTNGFGQMALTAMAIGLVDGTGAVTFATGRQYQGGLNKNYFFFVKDDWRILPRLSLSLGVRYELPMPWYEPHGYWGTFSPGQQSTVLPNAPLGMLFPGDPGVPQGIVQTPTKQIMPRVGFSYDVFGTGKTALRGGFGTFYNATNSNILQNGNQPWRCYYNPSSTATIEYPLNGIQYGFCNAQNPTFTGLQTISYPSPNFKPSYAMAYNFGIQQKMPAKVNLEINYVGKLGRHEMVVYQSNPSIYVPGSFGNYTDQRRMYQGYGDNTTFASVGNSSYNSLQVMATRRMTSDLTLTSSYTWGRSIDLNSGEYLGTLTEQGRIPYVWDLSSERGPSDYNATHVFNATWTFDLSKRWKYKGNAFLQQVLNGYSLSGTFSYRTGQPVNINVGSDVSGNGTNNNRPIFMGGDWRLPSGRSEADFVNAWFNTSQDPQVTINPDGSVVINSGCNAMPYTGVDGRTYTAQACTPGAVWEKPANGTWGNVGRNSVIGPPQKTNNMSLKKNFKVREGWSLQLRCDAYGVFNTPSFGKPNPAFGSNFGKINSTKGERQLQLSLKLRF